MGVEQAAAYLGVTPRTIDRWIKDSGLPVHRTGPTGVGRKPHRRFYRSELDTWLRNRYDSDRAAHPASGGGRRAPSDGLIG